MHFAGWSLPPPDRVDPDTLKQWSRVPLFLWIKARPLAW